MQRRLAFHLAALACVGLAQSRGLVNRPRGGGYPPHVRGGRFTLWLARMPPTLPNPVCHPRPAMPRTDLGDCEPFIISLRCVSEVVLSRIDSVYYIWINIISNHIA